MNAPESPTSPGQEPGEVTQADLEHLQREVDSLQQHILKETRPWYRDISTGVSLLALMFSLGTTAISYNRDYKLDIQATRQELRGILQRLVVLQRENLESNKKFENDFAMMLAVSGVQNQENGFLVRQASELVSSLPTDMVTAAEYHAVAVALANSYDVTGAENLLQKSIEVSKDFNTEINARRMLANISFLLGKPEIGRKQYADALGIFTKYNDYDAFTQLNTHVLTELGWANSEAFVTNYDAGIEHVDRADKLVLQMGRHPMAQVFRLQASQVRNALMSGNVR